MADYAFSHAERWAVFSVQGDTCYMCGRPLDLKSMEIDHIIPESLLKYPDILRGHLEAFGLAADFAINSYANWLPICGPCNRSKGNRVFVPSPIIQQQLERASRNAEKAAMAEKDVLTERQIARALNLLMRGLDDGAVSQEFLVPLIQKYAQLNPEALRALRQATRRSGDVLGFQLAAPELRLSPTLKVVFVSGGLRIVDEVDSSRNESWKLEG